MSSPNNNHNNISNSGDLSALLPPIGEFPIVLGDSFLGTDSGFHMFKSEFRPASIDTKIAGDLVLEPTKATLTLNHSQNSEESVEFTGNFITKTQDCLLLWDSDAQMYKLEKMEGFAQLKHSRKPNRNARGSFTDSGAPIESSSTTAVAVAGSSAAVAVATTPAASIPLPAPVLPDTSSKSEKPAKKRKTEMIASSVASQAEPKKAKVSSKASTTTTTASKSSKKGSPSDSDKLKTKSQKNEAKEEIDEDMEDILGDLDEFEEQSSPTPATQASQVALQPSASSPQEAVVDDFEDGGDEVVDQFSEEEPATQAETSIAAPAAPAGYTGPVDMFGRPIVNDFGDSDDSDAESN
eukprot:TRINITY_DN3629_c0_g3_i2.p2 TRINITY_DN3629_c0_g3~~TRINITY_DN3629_c0_g3_i2.p2  ORF type:complete len:352 (+),score=117.77 TRINITY_DN3629_c0_g3_i2:88-1143(+)